MEKIFLKFSFNAILMFLPSYGLSLIFVILLIFMFSADGNESEKEEDELCLKLRTTRVLRLTQDN
jgi:hypothetical protein